MFEKLNDSKGLPKAEKITDKMSKRWGTGAVVIPAPIELETSLQSTRFASPLIGNTKPKSVAP